MGATWRSSAAFARPGRYVVAAAVGLASAAFADGAFKVGAVGFPSLAAAAQETAAKGIFSGVGVVKAIDPRTGALTLDHEEIKGFMAAMEMMYRVQSPTLSQGLHPGDKVAFKIDAERYVIVAVEVLKAAR